MAKQKTSVTLSPDRVDRARALTRQHNLSTLLDHALDALIDRELERQWLDGHGDGPDDPPGEVVVDLSDVPWDGE